MDTWTHTHFYTQRLCSPGVEVSVRCPRRASPSAPPSALLQAQFGEDAHQHHDSHHSADDVDDEVCAVPVPVLRALRDGGHRFARVGPDGRVVVGADSLVQTLLTELAAEAVEAGTAAVQKDAGVAVERWVPLAHHVIVTLTTCPPDRRHVLIICVATTGGSGQPCLLRSVLSGCHIVWRRLVDGCCGGDEGVALCDCGGGDEVLGEGRLRWKREEEEEEVAEGKYGGCHAARSTLCPTCRERRSLVVRASKHRGNTSSEFLLLFSKL